MADMHHLVEHFEQMKDICAMISTVSLHTWNRSSLMNSLNWAKYMEQVVEHFDAAAIEEKLQEKAGTIEVLRHCRRYVLEKLLKSPFLVSHPLGIEFFAAVVDEFRKVSDPDEITALITSILVDRGSESLPRSVENNQPTSVSIQVNESHAILQLPSRWSFESDEKTRKHHHVATVIVENGPDNLSDGLQPYISTREGVEVICHVFLLTSRVEAVLIQALKQKPELCWLIPAWLMADVCEKSETLAHIYLDQLIQLYAIYPKSIWLERISCLGCKIKIICQTRLEQSPLSVQSLFKTDGINLLN